MVTIPNGVQVEIRGREVSVKGPNGTVNKVFSGKIEIAKEGDELLAKGKADEKALLGTSNAILAAMVKGVVEGYTKKYKALYAHFPITMEAKGKDLIVKNFLGEKNPRRAKIAGDSTKVEIKAQQITISGPDKEAVGQTLANLRSCLKIKNKDPRVFQDGVYEVAE